MRGKPHDLKFAAWGIPAAWKAVVRGGRLAEARVYSDVEPMLCNRRELAVSAG